MLLLLHGLVELRHRHTSRVSNIRSDCTPVDSRRLGSFCKAESATCHCYWFPGTNAPGTKALMLLMILIHSCLLVVSLSQGKGFPVLQQRLL